jgi:S-ribosylhomocysteine lyase LuxS involved in autoinducer biosynthesis
MGHTTAHLVATFTRTTVTGANKFSDNSPMSFCQPKA